MKEIKELAKRYTDEEIAAKLGVTSKTVYNWRTGKTQPFRRDRAQIVALYNKLTTKHK